MTTVVSDRPVGIPAEDLLQRYPFAVSIADMILNAPENGSLRIGVFGGWGEGKTSVLELIRTYLKEAGHICIWIVPWMFSNREEVIHHLLRQIASELGLTPTSLDSAHRDVQIIDQLRDAARGDAKLTLADILIGYRLKRFINQRASTKEKTLFSAIEEALGSKRLIVFIDDLDRVKPEIVPDLLLTLREALDYPNYFYVMALDPDVLERGLKMVHEGWGEPRQFLEKIIELPMHLPDLTEQQMESYANKIITSLGKSIDADVIKDLVPLLPQNPRRLKLLLRFIGSLHGLFSRFGQYELDWRVLYLCLMLRFEYPERTRKLLGDRAVLDDVAAGYMLHNQDSLKSQPESKKDLPEAKFAPESPPERDRFLALCNAIRERGVFRGRYRFHELLALIDEPPALTYKEIDDELTILNDQQPEARLHTLKSWLTQNDVFDARKAQALMDGLVDLRNSHLEGTADRKLEEEVVSGLKIASMITAAMRYLGMDLGGFVNGILSTKSWIKMFKHFSHWSHFSHLDYYDKVREEERLLLKETAAVMATSSMAEILEARELDNIFRHRSPDEKFEKAWKEIKEFLEIKISESLLKHFEEPNGLEQFWAIDYGAKGKRLLFDVKSHFHSNPSCRRRLAEIADTAKKEAHVQINYLTYFTMMCHGASDRATSFSQSDCRELLKDMDLVKMVWDAAIAQPLNPRMVGSLRQDRQNLIKLGVSEDILQTPDRWKKLEGMGFFQS
jgi:hypothetical protein